MKPFFDILVSDSRRVYSEARYKRACSMFDTYVEAGTKYNEPTALIITTCNGFGADFVVNLALDAGVMGCANRYQSIADQKSYISVAVPMSKRDGVMAVLSRARMTRQITLTKRTNDIWEVAGCL